MDSETPLLLVRIEAMQVKFERQMAVIAKRAADAAKKVEDDFARANGKAAQSFEQGSGRAVQSLGATRSATANLSFQLNDIATSLLGGASPFRVMAQQGGQVAQIFQGSGGLVNSMKLLGSGIASIVTPTTLATFAIIGLTGYLYEYFTSGKQDIPELNDLMKSHGATISALKESYGEAGQGLKEFVAESRSVIDLKAAADQVNLGKSLKELTDEFLRSGTVVKSSSEEIQRQIILTQDALQNAYGTNPEQAKQLQAELNGLYDSLGKVESGTLTVADAFKPFQTALDKFLVSTRSARDLETLREEIAKIVKASGNSEDIILLGNRVLVLTEKMSEAARAALATKQAIEVLGGTARNQVDGIDGLVSALKQLADLAVPVLSEMEEAQLAFNKAMAASGDSLKAQEMAIDAYQAALTRINAKQAPVPTPRPNIELEGIPGGGGGGSSSGFGSGAAVSRYVNQVVGAESGGDVNAKNPNSSATGLGQFISSTWLALFKEHFPDRAAAMSDATILALRGDAAISRTLIEDYAEQNAELLRQAGISVNEAALHLAHFLGPDGAIKVLSAAPGTPIAGLLSQAAIKANPTILGGGATVDDVIRYGNIRANSPATDTPKILAAKDAWEGLRSAHASADEALKKYNETAKAGAEFAKSILSGIRQDILAGKDAGEIFANVLGKIADKLWDAGINSLFSSGGGGGGFFGMIGKLFGFADGGIAAHGRPQPLKRFADGGVSNTAAIFGEAGPEAAVPLKGGMIPVDLRIPKGMGKAAAPNVTVHQTFKLDGAINDKTVFAMVQGAAQEGARMAQQALQGNLQALQTHGGFAR